MIRASSPVLLEVEGLAAGMQVVTIGSFFIDAEYRLKSTPEGAANAHHHH